MKTPEELERLGWETLTTHPAGAGDFFRRVLVEDVRMILPDRRLADREQVIEFMSGPRWDTYELREVNTLHPGPNVAFVTYAVTAQREDQRYSALVSSLYVRRPAGWRMVSHQHTPVSSRPKV